MDNFYCVSLAGEWTFMPDEEKIGMNKGYLGKSFTETVILPGTTDENKKGRENNEASPGHLSRMYLFEGFAWYRKEIIIPEEWSGKYVSLFLERTRVSHVWLDGADFGIQDSICAPQTYEFGFVPPGKHTLTILVDNTGLPIPGGHQTSEDTQTNWNGILGRMELKAADPVWLEDIQATTDVDKKVAVMKVHVRNETAGNVSGMLTLSALSSNTAKIHRVKEAHYKITANPGKSTIDVELDMSSEVLLWDEYKPALYELDAVLQVEASGCDYTDKRQITFGMRNFRTEGSQFTINSRPVFLRGKHDAMAFPITGYAPMDTAAWVRVFEIAKSYGINHYRFHTCCPPEACFAAADLAGIYIEAELPYWGPVYEPEEKEYDARKADYLYRESCRILDAFANHPSFVMFSLGNELGGTRKAVSNLIKKLKEHDHRVLFAEGANSFFWEPVKPEEGDFWVTMRTATGEAMVRGSFSHADQPLGHIQSGPPSTETDYSSHIEGIRMPVVGHEIGQYQTFPNFNEMAKYTGVLKPRNLEAFRERLEKAGMLHKADDFFKASGKLAVICYREEIEAALRTPGFGGFQLLDLQDFPGQGTALVGILDAFMDSKGLVSPETWREFCSDAVLLARFNKYTFSSEESFEAAVEIAYYRPDDMEKSVLEWSLGYGETIIGQGRLAPVTIKTGGNTILGTIKISLSPVDTPRKLLLELRIAGTPIVNRYHIWVYPAALNEPVPDGIWFCRRVSEAEKQLNEGRKVLLIPESAQSPENIEGFFASDFWCYPMFKSICQNAGKEVTPGTLGLLCNSSHPALKSFPTDFHSDWQWWHIVMNSRSLILDGTAAELEPIVQVIDNFERNHKLGLIFEAKCGQGKLMACGSDLLAHTDKPEVRQLLRSLLEYMDSEQFNPTSELDLKILTTE